MWKFLRTVLAVIIGLGLFFGFFLGLIFFFALSAMPDSDGQVKAKTILKIDLDKPIAEQSNDPFGGADLDIPGLNDLAKIGVIDIVNAIEAAADDENISAIYLSVNAVNGGFAQMEEIREALLKFKESGKKIISYSDYLTEGGYYLSSVADEIVLNPEGMMEFNGLSSQRMFYKEMFDKVGIKPQVFKVGEYKSAVEPYIRTSMSEEAREQTKVYLNGLYNHYLSKVAESRSLPKDSLEKISDKMLVQLPEDALQYQLVTELGYFDQVLDKFEEISGVTETDDLRFMGLEEYMDAYGKKSKLSGNRIAVIIAEGTIVDAGDDSDMIVGQEVAALIRKAREDEKVKAIVLRINSPGGSKTASDVMWREVIRTKEAGKPIIASMSDVAASGGYYMAMGCDKIIAQPTTITGSIGIFGLMLNVQELMEDKIGITFDRVNTGELSDLADPTRPMSEQEKAFFNRMVNDGYEDFISKVAKGRNMDIAEVKNVAGGRVWTGQDAERLGLVDQLGDFQDAIDLAVEMAGLEADDFKLRFYPKQKDFFQEILGGEAETRLSERILEKELDPIMLQSLKALKQIQQHSGIQARMPEEIIIR